jgi:hypothetical protein
LEIAEEVSWVGVLCNLEVTIIIAHRLRYGTISGALSRQSGCNPEFDMRKIVLLVFFLSFSLWVVAAYGETPTGNFKVAVGVEAKIDNVRLKQVKGFIVTPEGGKLEGPTPSCTWKTSCTNLDLRRRVENAQRAHSPRQAAGSFN